MAIITQSILVNAVKTVGRMTLEEKSELANEVFAQQPHLLASVIVQQRYGTSLEQLDVLVNLLLTFFQAMKDTVLVWPIISEDMQESCLKRVVGRINFVEGLSSAQTAEAVADFTSSHPEPHLIAFVFDELGQMDILDIKTEAEKYFVLAAVNMVECICEAAKALAPVKG
ncbi:hypothetical protein LNV09_14625 [Paucibacter sp. B2R-40]|uniref:hypothetical protein n=1 Tax=Paucibacter sp. B2R-40 TaxID=2893554 RepID=UPI0021E43B5D|nr:hypothetical protein [Paucibacter sp. B2R-40]MCV2355386.1 hypothetical protein [Paucibacter sp. B2R-40]